MIHDLELDRVRDPLLEQLLADVPKGRQERREGVDQELRRREQDDDPRRVERERAEGLRRGGNARHVRGDRPDDRVDQLLGDQGGDRRHDSGENRGDREPERQDAASGPDESEHAGQGADQRPDGLSGTGQAAAQVGRAVTRRIGDVRVAAEAALAALDAGSLGSAEPVAAGDDRRVVAQAWPPVDPASRVARSRRNSSSAAHLTSPVGSKP